MTTKAAPWQPWGQLFKQFRLRAGYASQTDLAEALSHLELASGAVLLFSTSQISRWENGQRSPARREQHLALIEALVRLGGIQTQDEANAWLAAGSMGMLTEEERIRCFGQLGQQNAQPQALSQQAIPTSKPSAFSMINPRNTQRRAVLCDWGDAPRIAQFHGRQTELAQLKQWLVDDGCQLVAIVGMGGVGKTALAARLAHSVADHFDGILWRSLLNAPPLDEMLRVWLHFLSGHQQPPLPDSLDERLHLLMGYLRERRILLVLDNCEAILQANEQAGHYRPGYAEYGQLLHWVASQEHQSCLLLTSRERPHGLARMEREQPSVRGFDLFGLTREAGRALLKIQGLHTTIKHADDLVARYSGNPLALKLVADTICELLGGDVAAFLARETPLFDDIREVLDEQFGRLSSLERDLVIWLAVEREPLSLVGLENNLVELASRGEVLTAIRALQRRSLMEQVDGGNAPAAGERVARFTLQNVVTEYVTERLLAKIAQEVVNEQPDWLNRYALLKAQTTEYVRQSQERLLVQPLAKQLTARLGRAGLATTLQRILDRLRTQTPLAPGYAAGNILNLLLCAKYDVQGYNFSHLAVWQAHLRGKTVQDIDFSYADLSGSVFTDTFSSIDKVAFSPDGNYLSAATGIEVRLWRTTGERPILQPHCICAGHASWVSWICFSPDGRLLASGSDDQTIRLWDTHTGSCLHTLQGHTGMIDSISFSPDGQMLYSGSADQTMRQWDVKTGSCLSVMQGDTHTGWWVSGSEHGCRLASCRGDQTVRLWDVEKKEVRHILQGHTDWVMQVAFSPDGRTLASASNDHTARLWDTQTGACLHVLQGHTTWVASASFSPDGRMVATGSEDRTVRLWDVQTGACLHILQGHTQPVRFVSFSADGCMVASGSEDQTVRLWDVQTGEVLQILQGHQNAILSVNFSPDGYTLATGNEDRSVQLWDALTGEAQHTLQGHTTWVGSVSFSPDGRMVASGSDDQSVRLWDVQTKQCLDILQGHTARVISVCFSPDGRILASGGGDRCVRLWDVETRQCLHILQGHTNWVNSASFSPDGHTLASSSIDWSIRLWDVQTAQCLRLFLGHTRTVESVSFSPDGRMLASGSADKTVRLWDVQTGECLRVLQGHTNAVRSVSFRPDGCTLASTGFDQGIRLWDVQTGALRHILQGHKNIIESVSFSPDGRTLASGSADQTLRLWNVETGECLRILRSKRPYERMKITGSTGLVGNQAAMLNALGAVDSY